MDITSFHPTYIINQDFDDTTFLGSITDTEAELVTSLTNIMDHDVHGG